MKVEFKKRMGVITLIDYCGNRGLEDMLLEDFEPNQYNELQDFITQEIASTKYPVFNIIDEAHITYFEQLYSEIEYRKSIAEQAILAQKKVEQMVGVKQTEGKTRWSLLPYEALEPVVNVLNYGAVTKYAPNNWKKVEDKGSYLDAIMRHTIAYKNGEENDNESKESHLAAVICNALFLIEDRQQKSGIDFKTYLDKLMTYPDYVKDLDIHKFDKE